MPQNVREAHYTIRTWSFSAAVKSPHPVSTFYNRIYKNPSFKKKSRKIKASRNYANFIPLPSLRRHSAPCLRHSPSRRAAQSTPRPHVAPLPGSPARDSLPRSQHKLKCKRPKTVELENHPTPSEVEKLRHRRVKGLIHSYTIQEKIQKRTNKYSLVILWALGYAFCHIGYIRSRALFTSSLSYWASTFY